MHCEKHNNLFPYKSKNVRVIGGGGKKGNRSGALLMLATDTNEIRCSGMCVCVEPNGNDNRQSVATERPNRQLASTDWRKGVNNN